MAIEPPWFRKDELHVSQSQISTYLLCSEKFRQRYVLGTEPSHRSSEMVFGSAMHAALAGYHEHLRTAGNRPPLEATIQAFNTQLIDAEQEGVPIMWEDTETPDRMREQARALIEQYHELPLTKIGAVERPFHLSASEAGSTFRFAELLVGVLDLIEEDDDGITWITELKTAARRPDTTRLKYDLQLSLYAAARAALGYPDAKIRFRFLLRQKKPTIETYEVFRDEAQIAEAGKVVSEVLRAIDHKIFYPQRGWACGTCPYRSRCGE